MRLAKLHVWVRTTQDGRDTASSTAVLTCSQSNAVKTAADIDEHGQFSNLLKHCTVPALPDGHRLAVGHGVVVEYESGRKRTIHAF